MVLAELRPIAYIDAVIEDLTSSRLVDIHNAPGNGGLAGAGLAHKAEDLTLLHLEGHIVHRFDDGMLAQLEHVGKVLYIE